MKRIFLIICLLLVSLCLYSEEKLDVALITINENRLNHNQKKIWNKLKPDITKELKKSFNLTQISQRYQITPFEKSFNSMETIDKKIFKPDMLKKTVSRKKDGSTAKGRKYARSGTPMR